MNETITIVRQPLKGVLLRVPLDVHAALRRAAYEQHTSINRLAVDELVRMTNDLTAQKNSPIAPSLPANAMSEIPNHSNFQETNGYAAKSTPPTTS